MSYHVDNITINTRAHEMEFKPDTDEEAKSIEQCIKRCEEAYPNYTSMVVIVMRNK